ncbi:MAG: ACT domain-containing protein [Bacillota bacterium]
MLIRQISVFLENRSGRLAEVCNLLGDNDIDIVAISISDTTDFGILRLIVDDAQGAEEVLHENQYTVNSAEVLAVRVDDRPGGLAEVLDFLASKEIDVEYMYAVGKETRGAIIIMKLGELKKAARFMTDNDIDLVAEKTLHEL